MSLTPNMNITLPTPEVTTGPEWANQIVDAFDTVDAHNHTAGNGVPIPVAGLNINGDLDFNSYNITSLNSTRYDNLLTPLIGLSDKTCLYFSGGDLFINNGAGTNVQITSGSGLNLASVGTIGGDYGAPGVTASAVYSDTTKTFTWTQAPTQAAKMAVGDLVVYNPAVLAGNPVTIKIDGTVSVGYNYFLPVAGPTANQIWRQNSTNTNADFVTVQGTASQVTVTHTANAITASLPNVMITPGSLSTTSTLNSGDDFSVATNKFTVAAGSGNTAVAGTLQVTGNTTLTGDISVNGGDLTTTQSTFNLVNATATTVNFAGASTALTIGATTGTATIRNATTSVTGNFNVNTTAFTVNASNGNTAILGTLGVTSTTNLADVNTNGTNTFTGTTNVVGTANVTGTLNVSGNGRGIVPLGAIIGMTTGLSGAMSVPATGVVSNGWMRADGAAIPGGNTVSGTTPDLSNSVYLRGSTTYGGTGGSNTTTLTTTELPAHTHTNTFALGGTGVTTGTGTFAKSDHTHNMKHVHQWGYTTLSANLYTMSSQSTATTTFTDSGTFYLFAPANAGTSVSTLPIYIRSNIGNAYTAGVLSAPSGSGDTANTATPSATATVTFGGSIDSTGSGAAFSNEPNYINVIYMIRVN